MNRQGMDSTSIGSTNHRANAFNFGNKTNIDRGKIWSVDITSSLLIVIIGNIYE